MTPDKVLEAVEAVMLRPFEWGPCDCCSAACDVFLPDPFAFHARGLESPARFHRAITPSDTIDLAVSGERPRVIVCTVAGNVAIRDDAGTVITYPLTAGQPLLFSPCRVMATGTTATVVGWW